ncbi:hypothetical protein DR192_02985 [Lawsonia intracellularis]|uniref:tetratricopeptide repeat protein n=1 Tax=Lawsonia intracellularis TaxID=29546 RepID=UPI000DE31A49|nr:tetratricopeptide repeat protein [Lawsonia intracellularis]RBN35310.1 hypothetical protein DR192_02985 [Lawsonia intracellularis]RBN35430.1 hypothetical protein DR193_00270 [Lawsonia intracellularis]
MKFFIYSWLFQFFLITGGMILFTVEYVEAVSWKWSMLPGRERIIISYDTPNQGKKASRISTTQLEIPLSTPAKDLSRIGASPSPESLVSDLSLDGSKLHINLRDAAFGYITTSTNPNQLIIDVFSDPLGNRWRNLGVPAPASAPSRASSALPEVPKNISKQIKVSNNGQRLNKDQEKTSLSQEQKQVAKAPAESITSEGKAEKKQSIKADTSKDNVKKSQDVKGTLPVDTKDKQQVSKKENQEAISKEEKIETVPTVPPPSVDELTMLTAKVEKSQLASDEYSWSKKAKSPAQEDNTEEKLEKSQNNNNQKVNILENSSSSTEGTVQSKLTETPIVEAPIEETVNSIHSKLNFKGPDAWPKEKALSTLDKLEEVLNKNKLMQQPETRDSLQPLSKTNEEKPVSEPVVVYVDEKGNPVGKPPDTTAIIEEAKKNMRAGQVQKAKDLLATLKGHALVQEQHEEVLYLFSELNEKIYKDRWIEGYEPIITSTNKAMNFNLRSPRVAEALMRLGMVNLRIGNQDEAAGYFGALRRKFPQSEFIPEAYLALGKDQFSKGEYADAVKTFQLILDNYPESKAVQDASCFMAEALFKQGHYSRALILVDFVDRRWPRLYLEDPNYLKMVGDLYSRENRLDDALKAYWTYYNLVPEAKDSHDTLFKIGTSYFKKGLMQGGKDVFEELLKKFPKSDSAPKALLALGEEQVIKENPTIQELVTIFENPSSTIPEIYYKKILDEYPNSPEAQQAAIRLAAWKLWHRDIPTAMTMAQQFLDKYPESPYAPRAEEIIARGFDQSFALALQEENYERILSLWEKYPYLQIAYKDMTDELRVALARAYLNRGDEEKGMDLLNQFLESPQDPNYGDYVYNLYLAHYLRKEDWTNILKLGEKVSSWKFPVSARAQLDYALAIASENLGLGNKALPLWERLYQREDIPLYQKAYANYFMARDAERRRDLNAAYKLNLNTLKLFVTLQEERSDKADPERVRESLAALMDVTEVANRFVESLEWADQYAAFVPETSPDYAGLLFRKARLYRKMGDLSKWKQLLDEIVRREPESVFGRMAASELRTYEVSRDLSRFTQ